MGRISKKKQRQILLKKARNFGVLLTVQVAILLAVSYAYFSPLQNSQSLGSLQAKAQPAKQLYKQPEPKKVAGKPVYIQVPKLGIELQVLEGVYDQTTNSWTLSGYNPHFALPSAPANNKSGATLVYGHNNKYVFGPLKKLVPGDIARIQTDNGHVFTYVYESSENVDPYNTSVLAYQGAPVLVLQTCSGFWNEWRQMFYFRLQQVIPAQPKNPTENFPSWLNQQLRFQPSAPALNASQ